jgi:Bacterial regulatory proteins, tetR family
MKSMSRNQIISSSKRLFAAGGYESFSIRKLATDSKTGLSSIYHFFKDKDQLLKVVFDQTNIELGNKRRKLPHPSSAGDMLKQRIKFQFDNIEDIIFVLKYYLHFRPDFLKLNSGYIPTKGYLHIEEVLSYGVDSGEFTITTEQVPKEAKIIAHAINGFLLEYYPDPPKGSELLELTDDINRFLLKSLTSKEVNLV